MTNRKSHARFRLVPKSMTLDDIDRDLLLAIACGFLVRVFIPLSLLSVLRIATSATMPEIK